MSRNDRWDVDRLTADTWGSVPMAEHTRIRLVEAEAGRVVLTMPLEGNGNHIGTMYAGALFTLAEIPGGTLFLTTFDPARYYPVVKGMTIQFRRFAVSDITVEARLAAHEVEAITTLADADGKADYTLNLELRDVDGEVVATSSNQYQMRAHGR